MVVMTAAGRRNIVRIGIAYLRAGLISKADFIAGLRTYLTVPIGGLYFPPAMP